MFPSTTATSRPTPIKETRAIMANPSKLTPEYLASLNLLVLNQAEAANRAGRSLKYTETLLAAWDAFVAGLDQIQQDQSPYADRWLTLTPTYWSALREAGTHPDTGTPALLPLRGSADIGAWITTDLLAYELAGELLGRRIAANDVHALVLVVRAAALAPAEGVGGGHTVVNAADVLLAAEELSEIEHGLLESVCLVLPAAH